MSSQDQAFITPTVVQWARERARVKRDEVAKKLGVKTESVAAWEAGKSRPRFSQAQRLADALHVPFGYLFLPKPPEEAIPLRDFRTLRRAHEKPSAELMDSLNDVIFKQQWFRDLKLEEGAEPLSFVGRYSMRDSTDAVAQSVRNELRIDTALREACISPEEFLRQIIRNAETAGILVMRSGIAAGNTRRRLSVQEFRGFAISDPIAPLIFLNGADSQTAQIFTAAHELVHLWIGETGVSNETLKEIRILAHANVERFCNQTAAEVLVPRIEFLKAWHNTRSIDDNVQILSRAFKVSSLVVLRRAFELEHLTHKQYNEHYEREEVKFRRTPTKGGSYFRNLIARNGALLTSAVVQGALEGRVLYRDAARLLNVNVPVVQKVADYLTKRKEGT